MIKLFDVTVTLFASAPKRGKIEGYCRPFPTTAFLEVAGDG